MDIEKYLIKNVFVSSDKVIDIVNPYTNEVAKKVFKSPEKDVDTALDYLTEVQKKYKNVPTYIKSELLQKVSDKIKQRKDELAYLITLETGKPIKFSKIEVERAILTFRLGSELCMQTEGEILNLDLLKGSENKIGLVRRFPLGVILAITPWNFPINLVAHKLSPALASGNVVLLKPASVSLTCGIKVGELIHEASKEVGLDFCPVNVVTSSGSEIDKFLADKRVKMISFTGSSDVGWNIRKKVVYQKVSLELGGNAGVIVNEDADIETAVKKISIGGFAQAGQSCISVQRIFVHKNIYDKFSEAFLNEAKNIKYGNPFEEDTIVGPMITEKEAERIEEWIHEAEEENGKVLIGGERKGAILEPTVMTNVDIKSKVNTKEAFAPFVTLNKFDDFKQAVRMVDDSEYGLQAGVFTNNMNNAFYAYNNIDVGGVVINDVPTYRMDSMPYGGVKLSGNSREGVKYAMEEMTELRVMVVQN
ncbi:MAG TPA: aldehyde dehydrogenase family protein [Ignavibacteria bacterium]|nr:aldehyde dehydrogenase family protein [Ignavibacteria bacterium]